MSNKKINKILDDIEENKITSIYGNIGIGKYTYIKKYLQEKYTIHTFNMIDFIGANNMIKIVTKLNTFKDVMFMLNKQKKPIIIIKDGEAITKQINILLKKLNIKRKPLNIPIIILASGNCIKFESDMSKYCEVIKFENENENMNNQKGLDIIETTIYNPINVESELYNNVINIFKDNIHYSKIEDTFIMEKILLPLMIHENYKEYINKNVNKDQRNKCISECSKFIMECNIINEYIFNKHAWDLQKIYSQILCNISKIISKYVKSNKDIKLKYTKILTKNSMRYMFNKKYKYLLENVKYNHNFDKTLIEYKNKDLINQFMKDKKIGYEQMRKYNLCKKDMMGIIKITNEFYFIDNYTDIKKKILKKTK